ncbi:MAG: aldehyde dehydrogenase family protein [Solirubrobacteraceae bacterium]|jgi:acyl-CoA reductase-like NAD-dependent aldehyde dehydrogenase
MTLEHDADTIAVEDPATGERIAMLATTSSPAVAEAVERARAAQSAWAALGFRRRAEVMFDARRWLIANRRKMVETIVAETGKPWEDAFNVEIVYVAHALGFWHPPAFLTGIPPARGRCPPLRQADIDKLAYFC